MAQQAVAFATDGRSEASTRMSFQTMLLELPQKTKVLLVDDQPKNLIVLESVLGELKQELVFAHSGQEALRILASEDEFAVIVVDIMMPDMNGIETVRQLRQIPAHRSTPVIFLTAMTADAAMVNEAYSLGAADFLYKPVVPQVFKAKISVFVELSWKTAKIRRQAELIQRMERERLRKQLQRENDLFQRFATSVSEYALFLLDADGNVVSWNPGAEHILGYETGEILNRPYAGFFLQDAIAHHDPQAELSRAEREGSAACERWLLRKDRRRFWASLTTAPIRDESERVLGYSVIVRDNTERKRAEDILRQNAGELSRSNAELERFAYVASHDLKEPLRMVSSYVQLLALRYASRLDDEAKEFIAFATDGVKRMYSLINELLEYSQIGREDLPFHPVDCGALMREVSANLRPALQESRAELECAALPRLEGVHTELLQLFQNLISNAIKFRSCRPLKIRVSAERRDGQWQFSVADNGIGIDPEYSDKIFEIFQRLHPRETYPGSGIGLAICKKIVERHGGAIWFDSIPGEGTTFSFTLRTAHVRDQEQVTEQTELGA